jgi:hypothetical protein
MVMKEFTPRQKKLFEAMRHSFRDHLKISHPDWKENEKRPLLVCCLTALSEPVLRDEVGDDSYHYS